MQKPHLLVLSLAIAMYFPKVNFGQTAPNLGKISSFGVYTAAGAISSINATVIKGDLGNDAGAITGFAPGIYSGNLHAADAVAAQADLDVHAAFAYLGGLTCTNTLAAFTGSETLSPGVYCFGAAASLTGELVFDAANNSKALFFINISGVLNTAAGFKVTLKNGASAANVYWRVMGAVNMGANSNFTGTVIAQGAFSIGNGAVLTGRALVTAGAINLDGNAISVVLPGRIPVYTVSTLAGNGGLGTMDGDGADATFFHPSVLALDATNNIYVANSWGKNIRIVSPLGVASTFNLVNSSPQSVAIDHAGNIYAIVNNNIQKVTPAGTVTTITVPKNNTSVDPYCYIRALALDASDNLYTFQSGSFGTIRKIFTDGRVSIIANLNSFGSSYAYYANSIAIDASGNIYVGEIYQNKIFKVTATGSISVFAGSGQYSSVDGIGAAASVNGPYGIAVDATGNVIVGDANNNKIRMITPAGVVTTIAGNVNSGSTDGAAMNASFNFPESVTVDAAGSIYIADYGNNKIRKMTIVGYTDVAPTTTPTTPPTTTATTSSAATAMNFFAPVPFSIIQNPVVNNQLRINMPKDATITIYNNLGQVLLVKALQAGTQTIGLPTLAKGMYHVKCGAEVKKFVVQ